MDLTFLLLEVELKNRVLEAASSMIQSTNRVWENKNVHEVLRFDPNRRKEHY